MGQAGPDPGPCYYIGERAPRAARAYHRRNEQPNRSKMER